MKETTFEIKKATRKAIPAIICFYGKSGGGKTYSALKLAKGLGNKICVIDTENGRASHYADEFDFDVIDLKPPFSPARYIEAIRTAQNAGYKAIIIDSISHEWEGTGGCLEMAEGKQGLQAWSKPKAEHRKMMNMLLQSKSHIIFCARAKDNLEQVKINGKTEVVNNGAIPIQEKNFPFEMLITFHMRDKGKVTIEKCIKGLENSLVIDNFINENHGKIIAKWIDKGESVDLEFKRLEAEAREEAINGADAITNWFKSLSQDKQALFSIKLKKELFSIAQIADKNNPSEPKIVNDLPPVNLGNEGDIQYTPEQIKEMEEAEKKAEEFRKANQGE